MNAPKKEEASKNKYKLWSGGFNSHLQVYLFIIICINSVISKTISVKIEGMILLVKKYFYLIDPLFLKKRGIGLVSFHDMIPEPIG